MCEFQDHLRDFLVQIREFTGEDDTDLYLEEREVRNKQNCTRFLETKIQATFNPTSFRPP